MIHNTSNWSLKSDMASNLLERSHKKWKIKVKVPSVTVTIEYIPSVMAAFDGTVPWKKEWQIIQVSRATKSVPVINFWLHGTYHAPK